MFVQIIRSRVTDPDAVRAVAQRWVSDLAPGATGWLGSTAGVADDGQLFVMARFDSEESARANSDRPEQGRWWAELEALLDGAATFADSTDVEEERYGDPDTATFVQVMSGRTTDPQRARELMAQQPDMWELRPDILGGVSIGFDGGDWTMVNYFTSEEEARRGEKVEMPPEAQELMGEMMKISAGEPEFLDLREPWMDSPR